MFIYKIVNNLNNKIYIGQTIQKNVDKRWAGHKSSLHLNKHKNPHLQYAWNKYGEENFTFEVIEKYSPEMNFDLNNLEIYWINFYDSTNPNKGYNKKSGGQNGGSPSLETRNKISASLSGEKSWWFGRRHKESTKKLMSQNSGMKNPEVALKVSKSLTGRTRSAEHCKKLSLVRKGKKLSEETKQKMSQAHKSRIISDEERQKKSASLKAYWAQKKAVA